MLDVPAELLRYLSRLLAAERRRRGTPARSRKLTCRDQAILALRWFRDRTRIEALGRDHGVSRATAYRYVAEAVDVLSAQAPGLPEALERALADGVPYVILDGKIFADRPLLRARDQREGRADRRLVLRQGAPPRRQRPGRHAPRRPPALDRPRRARLRPRHHRRPPPRPARPLPRRRPRNAHASPTAATRAPESASSSPSRSPPETRNSTSTPAPATHCCATCAAAANAGSPCSPSAGPPSSTSPPTPTAPPR